MFCEFCGDDSTHHLDGIEMCHRCAVAWLTDPGSRRLMSRQHYVEREEVNLADEAYRNDLMGMYDGPEMYDE